MDKTKWEGFLDFERDNKMFDFCDKYGTYVWDLIRSYVYSMTLGYKAPAQEEASDLKSRIIGQIKAFPLLLRWFLKGNKDYFFFLTSRNLIDGKLLDQIAQCPMETLGYVNCFMVESFASPLDKRLVYPQKPCPSVADLLRVVVRKEYDFSEIKDIISSRYPDVMLSENSLRLAYKRFYAQKCFYTWLFKKKKFKTLFVVQNNLQKGMFCAAHQLGIPVIELQHGIVNKSHMAYSYPEGYKDLGEKIFTPDKIFSFAPFWFKDIYNPSCRFFPIGNDYMAPHVGREKIEKKSFVVVSANVFGNDLTKLVAEIVQDKRAEGFKFYFKLHPNQFWQFDEYCEKFKNCTNVEVISNQQSMHNLLEKVENMLVITSTAVYEALYAGVKVFVYKRLSYDVHLDVEGQKGVYFVDSANDVITKYAESSKLEMRPDSHYFSKFNKEAFINAINE